MKEQIVADGRERLRDALRNSGAARILWRRLLRKHLAELRHRFFWRRWLAAGVLRREFDHWVESQLPSQEALYSAFMRGVAS